MARVGIDNFYVCEDISSNSHNASPAQLENNPTEPQVCLVNQDEIVHGNKTNNNNNLKENNTMKNLNSQTVSSIPTQVFDINEYKTKVAKLNSLTEYSKDLKARLEENENYIKALKNNLASLTSEVDSKLEALEEEIALDEKALETSNSEISEYKNLIRSASNINLDYLLENEVDAPPLPPSNDKKLEDQKTLKSLIEGSLKNLDNMDRITEDYQKEDDFIVKTHEIKTQPITDEQRNNLNTAYANSPSVETVETPVKPSNVSPSLPTQPKNIGIDLDLFNYIPTTEGNKEVYIEELHRRIVHKEGISNLEASFINKLKTCSLDEQILRLKFRYCFGPVNYILDNLNNGMITAELFNKLIAIAKKEKCIEGLTFLLDNFSNVIYKPYVNDINKAIFNIETDIPF